MPAREPTIPHASWAFAVVALIVALLLMASPGQARAADPARGALLFATPPAPGLLGCADCHSDNPVVNNFGNIWAGRNAVALIDRAIQSNTGGMGYLREFRNADDLADIAAYLGNSPAAVDFPATPAGGRSSVRTVVVATSTKAGAGGFSARAEGSFEIVASDCGSERPRFSSCSIELVFAPSAPGDQRGALVLSHDATPRPVRIALRGSAPDRPPAVAAVSPAAIDFGEHPAGLASPQRLATLGNDSEQPLTLAGLSVDGGFAIVGGDCLPGAVLGRGARCSVALRLDAGMPGATSGRLLLQHDGSGGSSTVALRGQRRPATAARLRADVDGLDFGAVPLDAGAATARVTLRNIGTADWQATAISAPGSGFVVSAGSCSAGLALKPGAACDLQVGFQPPRSGRFSATLRIGGDGLDAPLVLPLQGRGLPAATDVPVLLADASRLLFDAAAGQPALRQFTLRHTGGSAMALLPPRIDGPGAAAFAIDAATTTCGSTLAAGADCRFTLRFSADDPAWQRARLQLAAASGPAAALSVELAGRAAPVATPRLAVDAVVLRFGGSVALRRIAVSNQGALDARWTRLQATGAHAADFPLAGSCLGQAVLAPGARCELDVAFAAAAPGERSATLLLQAAGGEALLVSLSGGAGPAAEPIRPQLASSAATLVVVPDAVVFQAGPGPATPQTQTLRWRNDGNSVLRVHAIELTAPGFSLATDGAGAPDRCPAPPFELLPGDACSLALSWAGTSAGAAGGRLAMLADEPFGGAVATLSVSEAAGQRSNVGAGGGLAGAAGWWLALLLAVARLAWPSARTQ